MTRTAQSLTRRRWPYSWAGLRLARRRTMMPVISASSLATSPVHNERCQEMKTQRRSESKHRERNAERRADRREADDRVALLAAQLAPLTVASLPAPSAVVCPSSYVVGQALTSIPSFTGAATEDYDNYTKARSAHEATPFRRRSGPTNSFSSSRVPPRSGTHHVYYPKSSRRVG